VRGPFAASAKTYLAEVLPPMWAELLADAFMHRQGKRTANVRIFSFFINDVSECNVMLFKISLFARAALISQSANCLPAYVSHKTRLLLSVKCNSVRLIAV
jgi:hypothetical protein